MIPIRAKERTPCGAKCRDGHACKNTRIYMNGRCKNHGGLSTGAKTPKGKAKSLKNLLLSSRRKGTP